MYTENITVDGITYKMINDAEIRQELLPGHSEATAYGSWFCVRADETADDIGTVSLYEFKYVLIDPYEEDLERDEEALWASLHHD